MNYKERLKMEEQEEKNLLSPKRTFYVPDNNQEDSAETISEVSLEDQAKKLD